MFKSSETPPFAEMISNLFEHSNPDQKAGLLSHLLSVVPGDKAASELSPDQVQQIAAKAEARDPGIIERVSGFYAQHPGLMKAVGGMALAVAMKHMRNRS